MLSIERTLLIILRGWAKSSQRSIPTEGYFTAPFEEREKSGNDAAPAKNSCRGRSTRQYHQRRQGAPHQPAFGLSTGQKRRAVLRHKALRQIRQRHRTDAGGKKI